MLSAGTTAIAITGIIVPGAVAIIVQRFAAHQNTDQRRQEQTVARESRLQDWRRETYVRLLEEIDSSRTALLAMDPEAGLKGADAVLGREEGRRLLAQLTAVGSNDMRKLFDQWISHWLAVHTASEDLVAQRQAAAGTFPPDLRVEVAGLIAKRKKLLELAVAIENQAAQELQAIA